MEIARRRFVPGLPIVEIEGIELSFGGMRVIDHVDLSVACGERLAVIRTLRLGEVDTASVYQWLGSA